MHRRPRCRVCLRRTRSPRFHRRGYLGGYLCLSRRAGLLTGDRLRTILLNGSFVATKNFKHF